MAKITVADVEGEVNYEEAMKEFGIEHIDKYIKKLPDAPAIYRRGIVFGHRDFPVIAEAIAHKKKFAVLTGSNPSGPLHLGNKMYLDQALYLQKCGADVFIPISNDETYVFRKASLENATRVALDHVIPEIIACGFDPKKTKIFVSTRTPDAYELAVKLSAKTTFSTVKAIFGFTNETNPGQIFYAIMQSAHILFPQLTGRKPTVVPIGIDQDPYMRLVRDIAERAGFIKPSSTYHKFMPGLHGGKMSGSKPETCIFLSDKPETARKKIMGAFSGGAGTLKEHREKGGNPDIDIACQYLRFMFEESDKKINEIFSGYRDGNLTSGEVKSMLADKVIKFLKGFAIKKRKAKKQMRKFLIE